MTDPNFHLETGFATAMHRLGPFEPNPVLAVAVSGGADSMALAILARNWAATHGASIQAFVVDHGLRPASLTEATITVERLAQLNITSRLLPLLNLSHGSALAERARTMRYQTLTQACQEAGILHLLLGHHVADQIETLAMRVLQSSQTHGLAGMSALRETAELRMLRPLLAVEPAVLREFLIAHDAGWVEDPSNQDLRATRPRLRHRFAAQQPTKAGLPQALSVVGRLRSQEEASIATELASRVTIRPEGFAWLSPGRITPLALGCLLRTIGGLAYLPSPGQITELAARPGPATLAGVRIMAAGGFRESLLIVREEAAIMDPVVALPGTVWDKRFRLITDRDSSKDALIGKLGADAARFRNLSDLPSTVLRTLPAIRHGKVLEAVPHLGYRFSGYGMRMTFVFDPPTPVAGPAFVAAN